MKYFKESVELLLIQIVATILWFSVIMIPVVAFNIDGIDLIYKLPISIVGLLIASYLLTLFVNKVMRYESKYYSSLQWTLYSFTTFNIVAQIIVNQEMWAMISLGWMILMFVNAVYKGVND